MNPIGNKNSIICLNAQGFLKHKDQIENLLLKKFRPRIAGFTETHVTSQIENHELQMNGYVYVRGNSEISRSSIVRRSIVIYR